MSTNDTNARKRNDHGVSADAIRAKQQEIVERSLSLAADDLLDMTEHGPGRESEPTPERLDRIITELVVLRNILEDTQQ